MKAIKLVCLSLFIVTAVASRAGEEPFRTDINPALRYYQAFMLAPDLSTADRDYLFDNDWRGQKLPERFGNLVAGYNAQFRFVGQAAHATVPCDWGIDMSPGTATLLPQLARIKAVAQMARFRAMWDLQNGRQAEARDDLIAALALGRNGARDGTLISTLVQIASEAIIYSAVAENFGRFSPETLKQLVDGFDAAPARITMAACMPSEKSFFYDSLVRRIEEIKEKNPGDDAKAMAAIREVFPDVETDQGAPTNHLWKQVTNAAGGTSEGVLKLLSGLGELYAKVATVMALPQSEYDDQVKQFSAEIQKSMNPMISSTLPAVLKARPREFRIQVTEAMVRAAVEYKLHGEEGLKKIKDPCGQGPFAFERFVFKGVDRGFKLTSAYTGSGFQPGYIFVEKAGPPFRVDGPHVGEAITK